ncbi:hypothetical protein PMZ80_004629 [Knufia obscura]|uniref:Alpha/beta hydrolase fold-3 domain-containing protein n=2 Tax=Knufia TaxID=430999 RepID=A0AAN8ESH5_9EURO|nr:hypothetical protein PMZ80_004629 [Knufia obscura]KAK5952621.1 hypothetical protein OHC33_006213 [Knufia fluminis]
MATLTDKLLIVPTLGLILSKVTYAAVTGPFRGSEGAPTYFEHVMNTLVRGLVTHMSTEQIQWISPSFIDAYKSWCTKQSLTPDIVDIPNTAPQTQGFWIGSKSTAKYTMVFYHGGGFMAPGSANHIDLLFRLVKWSNNNLAVFCVAYTLSPGAVYPTAIHQSVEGLRYILDLPGHSPETTLIGGDSAGGNLVLAVLSHISGHPHPQSDVVKSLNISTPLKGALAIAPWVSSDNKKYPSMDKFRDRDIVNTTCAMYWIEAYKGRGKNIADDEWICAATAPAEWWKDVKCEHMLVCAGEHEGLVDAVTAWAAKYKEGAGAGKIKYVVGVKETHDAPLNGLGEAKLDSLGEKSQEGAIRKWVKEELV